MKLYKAILLVICISLVGCKKNSTQEAIQFTTPKNFPVATYPFSSNPVTTDGFLLGKKLFYDGKLSRDGTISCGSCHIQYSAFSHHGHTVSHGIEDKTGTRNAPGLQNLAWSDTYFWDGGVHNLDMVPFNPIQNPVEMDEQVANILIKLKADATYKKMFFNAFGSEEINAMRMMQALSQYMNMLISADSKYDNYINGNTAVFSADEVTGYNLFKTKCGSCHKEPLFTDATFKNNGMDTTIDIGRAAITLNNNDRYLFKVPSLRNIEKTAPYMHAGQIGSLEGVIDHYRNSIVHSSTLDSSLQNNIQISDEEKRQLVLFLKTLTDQTFLRNPNFSE